MEVVNLTGSSPERGHDPDALWLVGCGSMAGAMVQGWRTAGLDLSRTAAIRPSGTPVEGVRTVRSIGEAGVAPGVALLGFKPQKLGDIAPELSAAIDERTIVLSMLAGVELATLRARLPSAAAIVRIMPNLPVSIRRGVVAVFGEELEAASRNRVAALLVPLGFVAWCDREAELGAVGSVAGAGPAYVARFIAALAAAGEGKGLNPQLALTVARETVLGTGWLAAATGEPMDEIVRGVKSPNGTTEAGLAVLDAELPDLVERTIAAAGRRAAELAAEARGIDSPVTPL
ncbi:pyrroline-5-carboxylate reductase family protein [Sphingomonas sp. GCM10030256]|uniref:pyrroline-5-carboxylate reductase family protein n=1 Tax=Sphingomonas sp. GCM10030256 TaxID=3273427 RepID=UPI0036215941